MSSGMSAKKLKERLDRKKRYQIEKDYKNAVNGPPTSDEALAKRQHAFCVKVINGLLEESHALSFSKPVTELWDVEDLPGYFDKVRFSFPHRCACMHFHLVRI